MRNFLDDIGCKIVFYLERVARGLSICTTCLLSMVQAITISPRTTLWRKLKPRTAWQVLPSLLLFWVLNFLISSNLLHYITSVSSVNNSKSELYVVHCYILPSGLVVRWLFLSLMALRDVIFQSLMGWSSGYMAFHLYEHHKHVLYLHKSRSANNSSPEIRAIRSTLILMTCFLFFYWADFIFSLYIGSMLPRPKAKALCGRSKGGGREKPGRYAAHGPLSSPNGNHMRAADFASDRCGSTLLFTLQ
ncbi:putative vomeronasal receptor-like protein 4 [Ctenodactylus gundi]